MRTTVGALAFILATMLSSAVQAQVDDGFDAFWDEANADFDTFLEEEDKAFSDFLRDPWKEFESEKPDELPPAQPRLGRGQSCDKSRRCR